MIDYEMRSRILFETLAIGSGLGIQIGNKYHMSVHMIVRTEGWTCHVSVQVDIRTKGWACHMSNGGVPCEATTCTLRGGPYTDDGLITALILVADDGLIVAFISPILQWVILKVCNVSVSTFNGHKQKPVSALNSGRPNLFLLPPAR